MFASVEFQHRSTPSQHIATDVFERASLSILRRYQRAAIAADFAAPGGSPGALPSQVQQTSPESTCSS
jgi:hypothetical protein